MADLEAQIRTLAERRFADTEAVAFTPDGTADAPPTPIPTTNARPIDGTEMIDMRPNDTVQPRRRWYAMAAAAAVIAIAIVGVALIARDDDPDAPATASAPAATVEPAVTEPAAPTEAQVATDTPAATTPTVATEAPTTAVPTLPPAEPVDVELEGADGNAEANAAFAVVVDAYEAFNRGDAIAWATAGSAPDPPPDPEVQYAAAAHAAGARYEVRSCSYDGFGEIRSVTGHRFTCQTRLVDEFTSAARLDVAQNSRWTVAEGQVIDSVGDEDNWTRLRTLLGDIESWLRTEHPEVTYTRIRFYNYPLASEVPTVLALLGEFVAASDEYPLAGE